MPDEARPDGANGYFSSFQLSDSDRLGFMKFVASGGDPNNPQGDSDVQKLYLAAERHNHRTITETLRSGDPYAVQLAMSRAGDLNGAITRTDYEVSLETWNDADKAKSEAHKNQVFGNKLVERMLSQAVTTPLGPLDSYLKSNIDSVFDEVTARGFPPPDPDMPKKAMEMFDQNNQEHVSHRSYMLLSAIQDAGLLPNGQPRDPSHPDLPPLTDDQGRLKSYDKLREEGNIGRINAWTERGPKVTFQYPDGDQKFEWSGAVGHYDTNWQNSLRSTTVTAGYPTTFADDKIFRRELRYGTPKERVIE